MLANKRALEIGGPSEIFGDRGSLPLYGVLQEVDNCLFSGQTIWTGNIDTGQSFRYHPKKPTGIQFICDATDLNAIPDASYDCILASHCLEHVANPLRALREWERVLQVDGFLVLILPHKDGIFDWRRPTTSLAHIREDYDNKTREDDLTHLAEILALHDLEMDEDAGSRDQFQIRCMNNFSNRSMHHHVFDTLTAVRVVNEIGFQLIRIDTFMPCHIIILARRSLETPNNADFLVGPTASYLLSSPFASDHRILENHD
jgi:SAM-dependent methyltransferase